MTNPSSSANGSDAIENVAVVPDSLFHTRSPVEKALFTIVVLAIGFTLYLAASLILPILIAAFLSILLAPAVRVLVNLHFPQPLAAGIVVTMAVGFTVVLLSHLYTPVQSWLASGGPADLRVLEKKLRVVRAPMEAMKNASQTVASIAEGGTRSPKPVVKVDSGSPLDFVKTMHTALLTTLTTILLVYFLLASGNLFMRKMVQATPRLRDKIRTVEIAHSLQREISAYFGTITLVNAGLGVITGAAMWMLGMPTPLALGVMVALLNFLPYLGPMLASLIIAAVAIVAFDTWQAMILPPAVYLVLHLIEGQLVVPFVLGRRMAVNPVMLFLWVLIFTWLWGAPGALLAVPLLVAVRICAERIELLRPLGHLLERDEGPAVSLTDKMAVSDPQGAMDTGRDSIGETTAPVVTTSTAGLQPVIPTDAQIRQV